MFEKTVEEDVYLDFGSLITLIDTDSDLQLQPTIRLKQRYRCKQNGWTPKQYCLA